MVVSLELVDQVAVIRLDDGKANAVSHALLDELEPALDEAEEKAVARLDPRQLTAAVIQARLFDPDGAVSAGYLDRLTDEDRVVDEAVAEAREVAGLSGSAYGATKNTLRGATLERIERSFG